MTTWKRQAGNAAAQQFVADYPTPRVFRQALHERNIHVILTPAQKAVRISCNGTEQSIGYFLEHGGLDVGQIYRALTEHARATETWTAPDGTQTTRPV